jgi:transcriptional regulator with PAS, ATPase and Fis domain
VRVIAATNRPLDEAVRTGRLRADFFYRLNVIRITMPPLRRRKADVPALVHHFLGPLNERFDRHVTGLAPDAMAALVAYDFPGNVRELENLLERAYVVGTGDQITLADLPALGPVLPEIGAAGDFAPLGSTIERVERDLITRALQFHGNDKEKAARSLGVSSRTLHRRIKAYNLSGLT